MYNCFYNYYIELPSTWTSADTVDKKNKSVYGTSPFVLCLSHFSLYIVMPELVFFTHTKSTAPVKLNPQ